MATNIDLKRFILQDNAAEQLRTLRASGELKNFLPELATMESSCKKHKDNVEHSIQVMENAKELSEDPNDYVLFVAALFHDVGKPKTLAFEGGTVTFRNHEHVGAKMARKFLARYGFSKDEIQQVTVLIREHMRGHTFKSGWTDSAIRRLATEAGSVEQINRLGVIFASDATSSNKARVQRFRSNALELRDSMLAVLEADALKARRPSIDGNRVMEITGLQPGRELGAIMAHLNSEEGLTLSAEEAERYALEKVS